MKHILGFLKLRLNKAIREVKIGLERFCVSVSDQFTDGRFRHALHNEGCDPCMTEEMSMQRQATSRRVVFNRMLESIDRERMPTSDPFEGYKNLINLWKKISAFLIQIFVKGCK